MANRILRDWTDSEIINEVSANAECLFIRLMMKADDFGNFNANVKLVKSLCFPLKDYREADISRWLHELQISGLIALYEADNKQYLHILNFGQRLRIMKPKYPEYQQVIDSRQQMTADGGQMTADCLPETKRNETKRNTLPTEVGVSNYKSVEKNVKGIFEYLKTKPKEIEPYIDYWNLFAREKKLPEVKTISEKRKKKLNVRIREDSFNFTLILKKASLSEFLLTGNWFGFDWIIENDSNYLKILEGNYQKNEPENADTSEKQKKLEEFKRLAERQRAIRD